MLELITGITDGRGKPEHIDLLQELADTVRETSLCGLGKTASNPVISTLRYFPEEYAAHINQKRCPAGVCKPLITYAIDAEICKGCGLCLSACPLGAIKGEKKQAHVIDPQLCNKCGICADECKTQAVTVN
jgi:ferredoxin